MPNNNLKFYPRNVSTLKNPYNGDLEFTRFGTEEQGDYQTIASIFRCDPLHLSQVAKVNNNANYPLIYLNHCPNASCIKITDKTVEFYNKENSKIIISYIDPFFTTEDLKRIKESRNKDDEALCNELVDIESYLKFIPGIGNILNQVAHRSNILEYIDKVLSSKEKSNIPCLFMKDKINGSSPIDFAL